MLSPIIAISQSNYIPWKGYFDLINKADVFVFLDDVQYTKRDWRNRNKIKTPEGVKWLSIPIETKNKRFQKIREAKVVDSLWAEKHWFTIKQFYQRAPFFRLYESEIQSAYEIASSQTYLSEINVLFIKTLCDLLGITTELLTLHNSDSISDASQRLVSICQDNQARSYLSGPAAKLYMNCELFEQANIDIHWMQYSQYPEYTQCYPPFDHQVSILDCLYHLGPNTLDYIRSTVQSNQTV
ncbi:MAG: WbqC family protein [Aestuariibacter sp.]